MLQKNIRNQLKREKISASVENDLRILVYEILHIHSSKDFEKTEEDPGPAVYPPTGNDRNEEDSSDGEGNRETLRGRKGRGTAAHANHPASMATGAEEAGSKETRQCLGGLHIHFNKHRLPPPQTDLIVSDLLSAWVLGKNPAPGKMDSKRDGQVGNRKLEMESQSLPIW